LLLQLLSFVLVVAVFVLAVAVFVLAVILSAAKDPEEFTAPLPRSNLSATQSKLP
jgi:hypothetical protein